MWVGASSLMMWHSTWLESYRILPLKTWTLLVHLLSVRTTCPSCQSLVFTSTSQDRHQVLILLVHGVDHHHPGLTLSRSPVALTHRSTISCEYNVDLHLYNPSHPGSFLASTRRSLILCEHVLSSIEIGSWSSRVAVCVSRSWSPCVLTQLSHA